MANQAVQFGTEMSLRGGIEPEKEGKLAGFLCLQVIPLLL
jgi:hypothetical protein